MPSKPVEYRITWRIATAALLCELLFVLAVVVSQVLRPELSPAANFVSEYAVGEFGSIMTIGFAVLGVGILLLAAGLWRYGVMKRYGGIGTVLLGISGTAMLGVAIFPVEMAPSGPSLTGQMHDLAALIHFASVTVGALLLSVGFLRDDRWRHYARSEVVLAVVALAACVLFFTVYPMQAGSVPAVARLRPVIGIFQRVLVFSVWVWLTVTTIRLRRLAMSMPAEACITIV